jgi:sporulation protein YlmC with PRC-barrel domain
MDTATSTSTSAKRTLRTMNEADLTLRDRAEDIRDRKVIDAAGEEIGKIDALMVDDQEHKVRFLRVASGGFLGMGKSKVLIPVEAIKKIEEDVVHVDQTRDHVANAPDYNPDLVDDRYYESLYGHYGYQPYWGAGYAYSGYSFLI